MCVHGHPGCDGVDGAIAGKRVGLCGECYEDMVAELSVSRKGGTMTEQEIVAVVQAKLAGKVIQARIDGRWFDIVHPVWDFAQRDYRVKSEPLELWVNVYVDSFGSSAYGYATKDEAKRHCGVHATYAVVHMREVVE